MESVPPGPPWSDDGARPPTGPGRELAWALQQAVDVRAACRAVVEHLAGLGIARPSVYLAHGGRLRCQAAAGYWQVFDGMPPGSHGIGTVYRTGLPLFEHGTLDPAGPARAAVPVRVQGRTVGVVNVEAAKELPPDILITVTAAADALGTRLPAVSQPGSQGSLRRFTRHAVLLAAAGSWSDAVDRVLDAACDLTGLGTAVLAVRAQGAGTGPWRICGGVGPWTLPLAGLTEDELALVASWVDEGTSSWTTGAQAGAGLPGHELLRERGVRSLAVVPLDVLGERLGVLLAVDDAIRVPSTDEAERLELLGALAAGILRTLDAVRELGEMAQRDALTGLGHHGRFHADLRTSLVAPSVTRPAVLLLDLDRFKDVNDTAGHLRGDEVLRRAATAMAGALRGTDRAYRIGGDEFAVLVTAPEEDGDLAAIATRLRDAVTAEIAPVTVSLGFAVGIRGEAPESLVARADEALYSAKRAGRDGQAFAASVSS